MADKKYTPGFLFNIMGKSKINKILGYKSPDYYIDKTPKKPMKKSEYYINKMPKYSIGDR
jgi:hypothetical protein